MKSSEYRSIIVKSNYCETEIFSAKELLDKAFTID